MLDGISTILGRDVGAFLLALGLILVIVRKAPGSAELQAIMLGNMVSHFAFVAIDSNAVVTGGIDANGWIQVAQHALLGIGFAFYLWQCRSRRQRQRVSI